MSELLLFFTSNARPLYRRDLLNICTEPEGANIRLGYSKKWVDDNIQNKISKGAKGLIIFSEIIEKSTLYYYENLYEKRNQGISNNLNFYPVRLGEVVSIKLIGESYLIDLKLGKFFSAQEDYKKNEHQAGGNFENSKQPLAFQKYINSIIGNPNTINERKRRYILIGEFSDALDQPTFRNGSGDTVSLSFSENCLPLIENTKKLSGLNDCYYICGLEPTIISRNNLEEWAKVEWRQFKKDIGILSSPPKFLEPQFCFPKHEFDGEKNSYKLKAGRNYSVKLLVIPGKEASPDQIPKLSIEETISTVNVLGPFVKQNPFGFQAEYIVRCKSSLAEEWGGFFVRIKNDIDKEIYKSSEIFGLIKVKRDKWFMAIFFLIPASIFFTFVGPDTIRDVRGNAVNDFLCNYFCTSPTNISWLFKFVGVGLSLMASYILTSKVSHK